MTGDRRATSELLGFALVFALVTASIAMVYAGGIQGLQDARRGEQLRNVERAFDVLDDNLEDVHRHGAPSRATEISLLNGQMSYGRPVEISVYVENTADPSINQSITATVQPLVYTATGTDTEIVYSMGAVVRDDGGHSTMLSEPGFVYDGQRAVLPLVVTRQREGSRAGLGGSTTILIVAYRESKEAGTPFLTDATSQANVSVTVESPRADAWNSYFRSNGFTAVDADAADGAVTYYFETDRVYLPRTEIEFELKE